MNLLLSSLIHRDWLQISGNAKQVLVFNQSYSQNSIAIDTRTNANYNDFKIYQCKFVYMGDRSINIYGRNLKLVVQESTFAHNRFNNFFLTNGFNIVFGRGGDCYQNKVCVYNCTHSDNFYNGFHSLAFADKNYVESLSLSYLMHPDNMETSLFSNQQEWYRCSHSNISTIKELTYIDEFGDITEENIIDYNTYHNFTGNYLFRYYTPSNNDLVQRIIKCNFIENAVDKLITSDGITVSIEQCNFVGNVKKSNNNPLTRFETEKVNTTITLSDCYISTETVETSGSGTVSTKNNANKQVEIKVSLYGTYECNYDYKPPPTDKIEYGKVHKWVKAKP